MPRWQTLAGIVLGLAAAGVVLAILEHRDRAKPTGPMVSECDGHLTDLVIQYEPSSRGIVERAYHDFLRQLGSDITVYAVCPDHKAFEELASLAGPLKCRLVETAVGHAMTTWSRDRWVALSAPEEGGLVTVLGPHGEDGADIWPARAGDQRITLDLAKSGPGVLCQTSPLYFDGGDFLADGENVFVTPRVPRRNVQRTVADRQELESSIQSILKKHVILLEQAPDHHAGMFMMAAGNRTVLVGDPGLAAKIPWDKSLLADCGGQAADKETQELFDAVARQCKAAGYTVVRIPVAPGCDGRTYLTYVNVIIDQQASRRIVYMPIYRGAEALNAAARAVWEKLGFEVRPVDCTSVYRNFGSLHCLVNVLRKK